MGFGTILLEKSEHIATLTLNRPDARNAIDLAHVIGIEQPRVAILAAVEHVFRTVRSHKRPSVPHVINTSPTIPT